MIDPQSFTVTAELRPVRGLIIDNPRKVRQNTASTDAEAALSPGCQSAWSLP
ncbi:hypothetical protein DNFV4_02920 [Nitrospira tepida]|uniref:Uncharacterized protein n=1 Tax=Nitrospira tepida TaxID=2973512 RepID=A0AA86T5H8_9BACT|nr:hypothetical protein DNFV4_02920 [Nitrospira tepida]